LRGHTLGVLRGTIENRDYFAGNDIKVEESDSVESLLKKLKRGRIDFCILVSGTGQYMIQKIFPDEPDNFAQKIIPESARPLAIIIDVAVPEGRAVAQRYRQVLDNTLRSREYHEILSRFYGDDAAVDRSAQLNKFVQYYANTWGE
jgi:polar amino acid transport system substrate-binding protein